MRRGAQGQTEQGSCLFEPQASLHETPAGREHRRLPAAKRRDADTMVAFLGLPYFGEAKKGKSPAAATERHRNAAKNTEVESQQGFDTSARSFDTSGRTEKGFDRLSPILRSFDTSRGTGQGFDRLVWLSLVLFFYERRELSGWRDIDKH